MNDFRSLSLSSCFHLTSLVWILAYSHPLNLVLVLASSISPLDAGDAVHHILPLPISPLPTPIRETNSTGRPSLLQDLPAAVALGVAEPAAAADVPEDVLQGRQVQRQVERVGYAGEQKKKNYRFNLIRFYYYFFLIFISSTTTPRDAIFFVNIHPFPWTALLCYSFILILCALCCDNA
jgi:hypothetical protein